MNGVVARWPDVRDVGDQPLMAGALHRIDADTSGLVLVARTPAAFDVLRAQFAAQTVKKTYLALVEGSVAVGGTLENDLIHDPTLPFCRMIDIRRARARVRAAPLHAVTHFAPVGRTSCGNEERTLLEVTIYTGVTHQIRAQLALAGLHIVNDRLYGAFAVEGQNGHCLHALAAAFRHPVSDCLFALTRRRPTSWDLPRCRRFGHVISRGLPFTTPSSAAFGGSGGAAARALIRVKTPLVNLPPIYYNIPSVLQGQMRFKE